MSVEVHGMVGVSYRARVNFGTVSQNYITLPSDA